MKKRPNTTSLEFLRSDAGRAFTQSLIVPYVEATREQQGDSFCKQETAEVRFERLLDDFIAVLRTRDVLYPMTFRSDLADVYRERYFDLYPTDEKDACIYYLTLAGITRVLADLAINVWKLERGELGGYPNAKPDREFLFLHLQWAREAFGWWAANLARLNYQLFYKPPCAPDPLVQAMLDHLGDATESELAVLKPKEMESGCPVC